MTNHSTAKASRGTTTATCRAQRQQQRQDRLTPLNKTSLLAARGWWGRAPCISRQPATKYHDTEDQHPLSKANKQATKWYRSNSM
jgi:hypothetical protein